DRDAAVQRDELAAEVETLLPGFSAVRYPDWKSLLDRFFREAPIGAVLAIDEFPSLVRTSQELPSILQKVLDARSRPRQVILSGSSQTMMHGLVLEGSAPLYGRAHEILKLGPLPVSYLDEGLRARSAPRAVEAWACFGGVPRYWELARPFRSMRAALTELVLDRLGVLHSEPDRLLSDEFEDAARASSLLTL